MSHNERGVKKIEFHRLKFDSQTSRKPRGKIPRKGPGAIPNEKGKGAGIGRHSVPNLAHEAGIGNS